MTGFFSWLSSKAEEPKQTPPKDNESKRGENKNSQVNQSQPPEPPPVISSFQLNIVEDYSDLPQNHSQHETPQPPIKTEQKIANINLILSDDYEQIAIHSGTEEEKNDPVNLFINAKIIDSDAPENIFPPLKEDYIEPVSGITISDLSSHPSGNRKIDKYKISFLKDGVQPSAHQVYRACKTKNYVEEKPYYPDFFKIAVLGSENMVILEAISNRFCWYLVPDVVTKSRAIYNKKNEYFALMSKGIPNFEPFGDTVYEDINQLSPEIIKGFAQILVSAYIFREDDLHRFNFDKQARGRVDNDMTFWDILHQEKGGRLLIDGFTRNPEAAFPFTEEDILNFPILKNNLCYYWPTKSGITKNAFSAEQAKMFAQLKDNPIFIKEKYRIMLKFLLTFTPTVSASLCNFHATDQTAIKGAPAKPQFISKTAHYQRELAKVLTNMSQFHDYMKEHGAEAFAQIKQEVKARNKVCEIKVENGKTDYRGLILDENQLETNYQQIIQAISKRQVIALDNFDELPTVAFA